MTNRREFLQIGVSASAWPLLSRVAHAAGIERPAPAIRIAAVVYDIRFTESVAFGERSAALGLVSRPIKGDVTRLWYREIYHQWQREPAAIAGLTAHGAMFCFAELARDVRMRMVFRAEHGGPGQETAHHVTGPLSMLDSAIAACRTTAFGASLAEVVARCPAGRHEIASAAIARDRALRLSAAAERARAGGGNQEPADDALYTWVIAPAMPAASL